jgi:hypothetical protein
MKVTGSPDPEPPSQHAAPPDFNPLAYKLVLHRPKTLSSRSAWVGHIPFAFALVEMLRPSRYVELGVFAGDSYCAFCQAVAELGLCTQCLGVDTWQGDPQNGFYPEQILENLHGHHDPLYSRFSRLFRGEFDQALAMIDDNSIDLLHIDGLHTYDAVRHDFQAWLPKLSRSAVVLFHDTRVRERDFGVYKLWEELSPQYPHFEFHHCCGLGVLAVGPDIPPALAAFLEAAHNEPERIREFFTELGFRFDIANAHMQMSIEVGISHEVLNIWADAAGESPVDYRALNSVISTVRLRERIQAYTHDDLIRRGLASD